MARTHDDTNGSSARTQEMVDELNRLLGRQVAGAREGNLGQVEQILVRTDALVAGLAPDRGGAPALTEAQRASVKHLYGELTLALRAERGEVQAKLKQLRQVKRAIGAYGRQGGT